MQRGKRCRWRLRKKWPRHRRVDRIFQMTDQFESTELTQVPNISTEDQGGAAGASEATAVPPSDCALLLRAEHPNPFGVLGPHLVEREGAGHLLVRTIQ